MSVPEITAHCPNKKQLADKDETKYRSTATSYMDYLQLPFLEGEDHWPGELPRCCGRRQGSDSRLRIPVVYRTLGAFLLRIPLNLDSRTHGKDLRHHHLGVSHRNERQPSRHLPVGWRCHLERDLWIRMAVWDLLQFSHVVSKDPPVS